MPRELCSAGCSLVPLWEDFLIGQIRKIQKNRKERMEERKRRGFFTYVEVPILVCSPSVGNASGYRPCVTLPQENPLIWEPPLQLIPKASACNSAFQCYGRH